MKLNFFRLLLITILLGGCGSAPEKKRCDPEHILLTGELMPTGWSIEWYIEPPALPKEGAEQALEVVFRKNGNDIIQNTAFIYKTEFLASFYNWFNDAVYFPTGLSSWSVLEGSDNWELDSDARKIKCSTTTDPYLGQLCSAVLRYQTVIIDLSAPDIIPRQEFKDMVLAIDQRIQACQP